MQPCAVEPAPELDDQHIGSTRDWNSVISLDLHGRAITRVQGLARCPNLRILDLSFNALADVQGCEALMQLKELVLHDNRLSEIDGLKRLTSLQVLFQERYMCAVCIPRGPCLVT